MDAAELREQADTVAEQQADALKEKFAAERPAPVESISFYVAECSELTFAGEYYDHLTMEQALEIYDNSYCGKASQELAASKIRESMERLNPDKFKIRKFGVSDVITVTAAGKTKATDHST